MHTPLILASLIHLAELAPLNEYPKEVMSTFLKGCQLHPQNNLDYCTCSLKELQARYTFREFTKLDSEVRETKQIPPEVQAIFSQCRTPKP
jgi:hypothetical protein